MNDKKKDSEKAVKQANAEKDAIDTLPLSGIQLTSNALKNAKLIKNARMETTLELYSDPLAGSLQINPDTISDFMETSDRDQEIIRSLSTLHSFDVYSLRSNLKQLGVEVKDAEALELSDDIKEKLSVYSRMFIQPMVEKIFGGSAGDLGTREGLQKMLRDTDMNRVRENLKTIAAKTGMEMADIPKFLEEYSNVFLSVAYYRYSFETVEADVDRFFTWMQDVKASRDVAGSPKTLAQCKQVEENMRSLSNSIRERLAMFQTSFEVFWRDINRNSFLQLRKQIEENHGSMGAVLCGLTVKLGAWKKAFPDNSVGGPATRTKFIVTELDPGLVKLKELETTARKKLGLSGASF